MKARETSAGLRMFQLPPSTLEHLRAVAARIAELEAEVARQKEQLFLCAMTIDERDQEIERLKRIADLVTVGAFRSFQEWVDKAQSWIGGTGAACVDSLGRRCAIGADFMRARDEGSFPVTFVYVPREGAVE